MKFRFLASLSITGPTFLHGSSLQKPVVVGPFWRGLIASVLRSPHLYASLTLYVKSGEHYHPSLTSLPSSQRGRNLPPVVQILGKT